MSYPDYELNEPTTQDNILKMLKLIYKKISSDNETNKLFYIKVTYDSKGFGLYLNYNTKSNDYFLSNKRETEGVKTKFTHEEIVKMKEEPRLSWLNIVHCEFIAEEV